MRKLIDDRGRDIRVGDTLQCEDGYQVIVQPDFTGKLVCHPSHSCADIPYHLNGGNGHTIIKRALPEPPKEDSHADQI